MKVFANGFNLFGQFECPYLIPEFTVFDVENLEQIEVSLSYAVFKIGNQLYVSAKNTRVPLNLSQISAEIASFSCGSDFILLVTSDGQVGKVQIDDLGKISAVSKFQNLSFGEKITRVLSGAAISVAISNQGSVFNFMNKLEFAQNDILDIKIGREHCLILDRDGNLYSFGCGSRGQLGHGTLDDLEDPQQIDALSGLKIAQISCGGWHSAALSQEGDLYTWGWNKNGQLGINDENSTVTVMATPHVVDFDNFDIKVDQVACGNRHTIGLLENSKLYGCGWNKYKQLSDDDVENKMSMTYLYDFRSEEVFSVQCGPWNSIVLCK